MIYGANVPVNPVYVSQAFIKGGLKASLAKGHRPHYLYGSKEMKELLPPAIASIGAFSFGNSNSIEGT